MKLILSTVGTSLLTNQFDGEQRKQLTQWANSQEKDYPSALIGLMEYAKESLKDKLSSASVQQIRRLSAELNGILAIYEDEFPSNNQDTHVLIATETYQGKVAAEIIKNFLISKDINSVIVYTPSKLRTTNKRDFLEGVKDLLKWLDKDLMIENYRLNQYEIIFNLTGGFKSLQGYLNAFGMFYADKITYIFESGEEIIEIPKLPVQIASQLFENKATEFLLMSNDFPCKVNGLPEVLLEEYGQDYILSEWGLLLWNKVKGDILSKRLITLPSLEYEDSFKRDFENATPQEKIEVQEILGKVSAIMQQNADSISALKRHGGIQYDNYSGRHNQIGHFRINSGRRVSCIAVGNTLRLRHFGEHNYVNDNP